MPCLDLQTPQDGVLTNKTAGIQGFVEANVPETHFRVGFFNPTHEFPSRHTGKHARSLPEAFLLRDNSRLEMADATLSCMNWRLVAQ
jgi:hypothetical protein